MNNYQTNKLRLLQILPSIQQDIAHDKGKFTLFAMLQRDNGLDLWDIVVSAPWIGESTSPTLHLVFEALKGRLGAEDMLTISRVVALRSNELFVREMLAYLLTRPRTESPWIEFADEEIYGIEYRRGFVFTWDEEAAAALLAELARPKQTLPKKARARKSAAVTA